MISVAGYGCTTAAGVGVDKLWAGLTSGTDFSARFPDDKVEAYAYRWPRAESLSPQSELVSQLCLAYREVRSAIRPDARLGILFASAKGSLENYIWEPRESDLQRDPLTPVIDDFTKRAELTPARTMGVSNACASSTAALWLAQRWLASGVVDQALVLAADYIGSFVVRGFHSLKSLSPTRLQPFSATRDGLRLGEAAVAILLERGETSARIQLRGVGLDTDGLAVTRPTPNSLRRAIALCGTTRPDLILAHGTGTLSNDETEDAVFAETFGTGVPITATKWCVGHTLGASGAVDLIAASEMLRRGQAFPIANTHEIDPRLKANYLRAGSGIKPGPFREILVSSLGFGGLHSAFVLQTEGAKS